MTVLDFLNYYHRLKVICNDLEKIELIRYLNNLGFKGDNYLNSNIVIIDSKSRYYFDNNDEKRENCIFIKYGVLKSVIDNENIYYYLRYRDLAPNLCNHKDLNINLGFDYIITASTYSDKLELLTILKNNNYKWPDNKCIDLINDSKGLNSIYLVAHDKTFGYIGTTIAWLGYKIPRISIKDFKNISDLSVNGNLYIEI